MNGRNRRTKVSIIIPAYNEEGNIEPLMTEFDSILRSCNFQPEVILVNDGSTDKTEVKMLEAMRRYHYVRLVKNRVRMGLTTALNKGFASARGDILVFYPRICSSIHGISLGWSMPLKMAPTWSAARRSAHTGRRW